MTNKSIYPSYRDLPQNENIIIEHTLKYADVDEIKSIVKKYGKEKCKTVWEQTLIPDKRLKKLNYFLAKFIFEISIDDKEIEVYFKKHSKSRIEKLNEILNR